MHAVSIVVLAYNQAPVTRECLAHLAGADGASAFDVVLVDNGSTDDTEALAHEFSGPFGRLCYHRIAVNVTCASALNRGACAATGDVLVLMNNDVYVSPGSVATLAAAVSGPGNVSLAGTRLLYPDRRTIQHAGIVPMLWGYASNYGVGAQAGDARFGAARDAFGVTGALMAVRRGAFEAVAGFDEGYVFGYEDLDLCLKVRQNGGRVVYIPDAEAVHHESLTLGKHGDGDRLQRNYARYRGKWDAQLLPLEAAYVTRCAAAGIRRVGIFGTGVAGRGLAGVLAAHRIDVPFFISTMPDAPTECAGRPVLGLTAVAEGPHHDAVFVASQFYFALEPDLPSAWMFPALA